ncbi:MAG: FlgD immunoglobulin-like domain containing protein [Candidatus Neomarinimicrobiota bacterium]
MPSDTVVSGGILTLVAEGGILYATGNDEGIYRTVDNGTTWTSISSDLPINEVYSLVAKDSVLFAGTGGNGVYRSLDNGLSWTSVNAGLPGNAIVANLKLFDKGLFAAIGDKIYLTLNSCANWIEVSEGLNLEGYSYVTTLGANSDFLFAGTNDGIWRRPLIELLSTENISEGYLPKAYSLKQNHPNPFNPATTILYELPHASEVSLIVYDLLGREVATLVDGYQEPGYYQALWDGRDQTGRSVPSGVYIARLVTKGHSKSIKMLLLK